MTLKAQINEDLKAAMKAGDAVKKSTLTLLRSVIQNRELEKRAKLMKGGAATESDVAEKSQLSDEEIVDAVSSEVKKRRESMASYEQGGRPELAESEKAEIEVLAAYLPEQLTEEEVRTMITEAIATTGAAGPKDMGKVMGALTPKTKGRFDGARISALVKEALGA